MSNCRNKNLEINRQAKTNGNYPSVINKMVIQYGAKSRRVAVWQLQTMRVKIRDSHLTCKIANKYLNVREGMEVVESNKNVPPFYCCPVNRQYL